ncbi:hypothetical protein FCV82_02285 [Vibrio breoganii]|uniref:hypothetical protein n=1 Tax=Vibrio breoganii TaxID=553239 RepID=UPI000C8516C1|nr:hypothetical protein [Vibrio breoganii]PMN67126.1 hypothetical protein BCT28_03995 [Vibrio breoganii]PMO82897.1 hypothetical protein BCT00_06605 [Vibrio breoganii]TKF90421.1 hypothetical protein FCV82_02285 [Vibrio breoganii]
MAKQAKRKYSRPALKKVVVVNSEASIDAMGQYVNQTMSAIYSLDVILFYIGSAQVAEEANARVDKLFEQKLQLFDKEITKLQKIVEDNDIEEIEYSEQRTKDYKVYSPLCATYIKLFKKFELNTNLIDRLWLNGELSSSQRNGKVLKLGRHMRNVSRQVINMSKMAMKVAQSEGKEAEVNASLKEIDPENNGKIADPKEAVPIEVESEEKEVA